MKFSTKITTGEIFQFLMSHAYAGFTGKIGLVISFVGAVLFIKALPGGFAGNETNMLIYGILAVTFTVINPFLLFTKAKKQKLTNPAYKTDMEYELSDEGIHLAAAGQEGELPWDYIIQIRETKGLYILYTTRINAFIWPKKDVDTDIMKYALAHIDTNQVKLPKSMRG